MPLSLRFARLLLVGAGAGALGLALVIAMRAAFLSPGLVVIVVSGVVFLAAARGLADEPDGAKLLAVAAAIGLGGMAVLAGFGAGDLAFPMGGLGVLAAWAALLHPPRRPPLLAFVLYVLFGVALTAPRLAVSLTYPWTLATIFLWPWVALVAIPSLGFVLVDGSLGIGVALVAAVLVRGRRLEPARFGLSALAPAVAAGALADLLLVAGAFARPDTSARYELQPLPLVIVFAAGVAATLGLSLLRIAPPVGALATACGAAVLVLALFAGPTVTCREGGSSQSAGPWWLAWRGGAMSGTGSGGGSSPRFSGELRRGDRVVIRYACEGARVVDFSIEP